MKKIVILLGGMMAVGSASASLVLNDAQWAGFGRDAAYTMGAAGTFAGTDLTENPRYGFTATVDQTLGAAPDTYGFVTLTNDVASLGISSTPDTWEALFFNPSTNNIQALMSAYVSGTKGGAPFTGFVLNPAVLIAYPDIGTTVVHPGEQKPLSWDMSAAVEFGTYADVQVATVHALGFTMIGGASFGSLSSDIAIHITTPGTLNLVKGWEFNALGDTETFTGNADVLGLTAAPAHSGSEGVLTSTDIIQSGAVLDPQFFYNENANAALHITATDPWATLEIRMRQLTGNPSTLGTVPLEPFDSTQTLFQVNGKLIDFNEDIVSFAAESNGWIIAVMNISSVGFNDLEFIRVDPVANVNYNFEIDYIRVFARGWGNGYDDWTAAYGLEGTNALMTADADGDTFDNLYEFAFGGDPTNAADVGFVQSGIIDDGATSYFEYLYARRTDANNGLEYILEQNGDLSLDSWITNPTAEVGAEQVSAEYEVVTNRIETINTKQFLRVEVIYE